MLGSLLGGGVLGTLRKGGSVRDPEGGGMLGSLLGEGGVRDPEGGGCY